MALPPHMSWYFSDVFKPEIVSLKETSIPLELIRIADDNFEQSCKSHDEFQLSQRPESLKALMDVCLRKIDECESCHGCIVRITDKASIYVKNYTKNWGEAGRMVPLHLRIDICLHPQLLICFNILAPSLKEAFNGLEYLMELPDTYYDKWKFHGLGRDNEYIPCPFSCQWLDKILATRRTYCFCFMHFTAEQTRCLASGIKTSIELWCSFQDSGAAFVDTYVKNKARSSSGPVKLALVGENPFNVYNFNLLLDECKLEVMLLRDVVLPTDLFQRVLSVVPSLHLASRMELHIGQHLIEAVREGRGPKKLCLEDPFLLFGSLEALNMFWSVLRGNTSLASLEMRFAIWRQSSQNLPSALAANRGLMELQIRLQDFLEEDMLHRILSALSGHPSLRTLLFDMEGNEYRLDRQKRSTQVLADMLVMNQQIEEISGDSLFDREDWHKKVVPRLQWNYYRKRVKKIKKVHQSSSRAALLGKALVHVHGNSSVVWLLLSQNLDVLSSYALFQEASA